MITELPSKVQRQELKQQLLWCVERITNVQGEIKCIFRAERRLVRHKISDGRGRQYSEIWIKYQNHFLQFWTLWRTWIEIAHQKVGTAASASKPSTTKRKEKKKKEDFNGLKRRRRRDFYRRRQKIHHRTDPHASREGGKKRHKIGQRLYQSEGKRGAPLTVQQILGRRTATFLPLTLQGETASKVIYRAKKKSWYVVARNFFLLLLQALA